MHIYILGVCVFVCVYRCMYVSMYMCVYVCMSPQQRARLDITLSILVRSALRAL